MATPMTMEELGRQIGCSPATISRILNNSANVRPEVRANVLKAVRESGYQPRPRKRQADRQGHVPGTVDVVMYWQAPDDRLQQGQADQLVLRPDELWDQGTLKDGFRWGYGFFRHIIDGIIEEGNTLGYKAALQVRSDLLAPEFLASVMHADNHGVLLLGAYGPHLDEFVRQCTRPLVLVDLMHTSWADVVTIDNARGIRQSFEHLYDLGHRDIGFVGKIDNPAYREREIAFQACMASAGLAIRPEWVFEHAETVEQTAESVEPILALAHRPTAFLCVCDYAAMGVIRAANQRGLALPEDLSVIGFDDMDAAAMVTPALSTVRVPMRQLGRQAVRQLLISQLGSGLHRQDAGCEIRVRTELVVRQSTARPPSPATATP